MSKIMKPPGPSALPAPEMLTGSHPSCSAIFSHTIVPPGCTSLLGAVVGAAVMLVSPPVDEPTVLVPELSAVFLAVVAVVRLAVVAVVPPAVVGVAPEIADVDVVACSPSAVLLVVDSETAVVVVVDATVDAFFPPPHAAATSNADAATASTFHPRAETARPVVFISPSSVASMVCFKFRPRSGAAPDRETGEAL